MTTFKEDELKAEIKRETGEQPSFKFGTFKDIHENVAQSIVALKQNPFLTRTVEVRGFVYDVGLDQLEEVRLDGQASHVTKQDRYTHSQLRSFDWKLYNPD